MGLAARRRIWNVFAVVDAGGNGLFQRIDGTPHRLITIFSECRQFRKIRGRYEYCSTVPSKFNGVRKHILYLVCDVVLSHVGVL